jgi:hypothetical protein
MAEEQLYGKEGLEHDAGLFPMPEAPPAKSEETAATEALETWSKNRDQEAKPIIDRTYVRTDGDDVGKPYPEQGTVSAERAAQDLADARAGEADLQEAVANELLGVDIDLARAAAQPATQQPEAQPQEAQPQQQQPTYNDGLDADPELAAALRNPKVLNAIAVERHQDAQKVDAAISSAAQWAQTNAEIAAAALLNRQELRGIPASQLPGALAALAQSNPTLAAEIHGQIQQVQVLTQQAQEAQRVQQQRAQIQFAQAAALHDAEFDRLSAASGETVEQRNEVARHAHQMLRDSGLSDIDIAHHWNSNPLLRSVAGQQILSDAAKYRMAKASAAQKVSRPIPNVQRPGSGLDRPAAADRDAFQLEQRFGGPKAPLTAKQAGDLLIARRARSSR